MKCSRGRGRLTQTPINWNLRNFTAGNATALRSQREAADGQVQQVSGAPAALVKQGGWLVTSFSNEIQSG